MPASRLAWQVLQVRRTRINAHTARRPESMRISASVAWINARSSAGGGRLRGFPRLRAHSWLTRHDSRPSRRVTSYACHTCTGRHSLTRAAPLSTYACGNRAGRVTQLPRRKGARPASHGSRSAPPARGGRPFARSRRRLRPPQAASHPFLEDAWQLTEARHLGNVEVIWPREP